MKKTLIIGLTGGIASGKSTLASYFKEAAIPLFDSDQVAHDLVKRGSKGLTLLRQTFGDGIIDDRGNLDRAKLAQLVFGNKDHLASLNQIIHPLVFDALSQWKAEQCQAQEPLVVIDMPLLYETGYQKQVDKVLVVSVSPQVQVQRLMQRNQYSLQEAQSRIEAQWPLADKVAQADYVIDNNGSLDQTKAQFDQLLSQLKADRQSWA